MKRLNLVFIAGLYHSGSTLLDIILGQHSQIVGLGEIDRTLTLGPEPMCSCGQLSETCPFWKQVLQKLNGQPKDDLHARMNIVLKSFQGVFGEEKILIDSSKNLEALHVLQKTEGISLKVIHLIRDVRGWTLSLLDRDRKDQEQKRSRTTSSGRNIINGWSPNIRAVTRSAPVRFLQWYRTNKLIERFLISNNIPTLHVGYEELVLCTEQMLFTIWDFLGVEGDDSIKPLSVSNSHIVRGNQMRYDKDKRKAITYDSRWLYQDDWLGSSLVFRPIMRYNSRMVYSNIRSTPK